MAFEDKSEEEAETGMILDEGDTAVILNKKGADENDQTKNAGSLGTLQGGESTHPYPGGDRC